MKSKKLFKKKYGKRSFLGFLLLGIILLIIFIKTYFFLPNKTSFIPKPTITLIPTNTLLTPTPYRIYPTKIPTILSHPPTPTINTAKITPEFLLSAIPLNTSAPPPDTTPPVIILISGPVAPNYIDGPTDKYCFLIKGNDNILTTDQDFIYEAKVDENSWSDFDHLPFPCFDKPSDGQHTFSAKIKDKAGNYSEVKSKNFNVTSNINPLTPVQQ